MFLKARFLNASNPWHNSSLLLLLFMKIYIQTEKEEEQQKKRREESDLISRIVDSSSFIPVSIFHDKLISKMWFHPIPSIYLSWSPHQLFICVYFQFSSLTPNHFRIKMRNFQCVFYKYELEWKTLSCWFMLRKIYGVAA